LLKLICDLTGWQESRKKAKGKRLKAKEFKA